MKKKMRRLKPLLMVMQMLRERERRNRGVAVRRQTVSRKRKLRKVMLVLRKAVMVCFILLYSRNTIKHSVGTIIHRTLYGGVVCAILIETELYSFKLRLLLDM
jgi:hypothetical protein